MNKPELVQRFTDNGEHSHWELVDDNGIVIWSENTRIFIIVDSLARQNFIYRNMFEKLELLTKQAENINQLLEQIKL